MWKNNINSNMHGISDIGPNVPAFLVKLWKLVEDPECDLIYWSKSGMSFIIVAQARFAREVLPLHYKHNNMASFIRQLNMYDFHKIASVESGGLKSDKDEMEFAHQYFIKDHPYLLENIKRKLSNPKSGILTNSDPLVSNNVKNGSQSDLFAKVLSDVSVLKEKQESWDARLSAMKRENEALWRELAIFRQKHLKQEQIINRLIHFIVTIVQPSRKVPLRRRFPLMLNDTQTVKKIGKLNGDGSQMSHGSPTGPTIHEIDASDVLTSSNEKSPENTSDTGPSTSEFPENTTDYVQVVSPPETQNATGLTPTQSFSTNNNDNPSDWLEIVLTEDDMITNPLTPIDPVKVNPTVAAATLKHMENSKKTATPITLKIPSIISSESGKKKIIPEKEIVYLADIKKPDKTLKRRCLRPGVTKIEVIKNKNLIPKKTDAGQPTDVLLNVASKNDETSSTKILSERNNASGKRKLSVSTPLIKIPVKRSNIEAKSMIQDVTEEKGPETKRPSADDSFWKLESLYNGSIGVNELVSEANDEESSYDENVAHINKDFNIDEEESVNLGLNDGSAFEISKLSPKHESENTESIVDFPPESMAVVCQTRDDDLSRELSSHLDNVQGEIDYLKEALKGEGYNLDMNNLLGLFNDDSLTYGMLQPTQEDPKEKEGGEGIMGNEVMTYGTPNLMDLVDLFGSTGTVQDWTNVVSPPSPTVSELMTPAPSPILPSFGKSAKRRKI